MRQFAFILSFGVASAVFAAVACSSSTGATCASLNKCTGAELGIAECNAAVAKCGSGVATLFACYAANEVCTSTGAIDETATNAAADANCAIPAGALTCLETVSFDGGSTTVTTTGNECGFEGEACCTEGGTLCDDGCCDPATKLCVSLQQPCSGGTTTCLQSDTGASGACSACGAPGEPCCPGDSCASGCCNDEANPAVCVAAGALCSTFGSDSEVCPPEGGSCTLCGDLDSPCCPGATCPSSTTGFTLMCDSTSTCEECGEEGDACCPGATCPSSTGLTLVCDASDTCQECGEDGDTCCPGDTCSDTSSVCSGGTCTFCGISGEPCCADDACDEGTCTAGTCM